MRLLVAATLLAACGDNTGYVSLEEYPAALRDARCRYYVRCGQIRDEAECATLNLGAFDISERFRWAVGAKHIRWNGEAVFECMQRASEASCDHADPDDWRCDALYEGLLGDGEECYWGAECISRECWQGTEGECQEACCAGHCVGYSPPKNGHIGDSCRFAPCAVEREGRVAGRRWRRVLFQVRRCERRTCTGGSIERDVESL